MTVLIGSIFIGTTTVQGTVQKQAFEAVALWDITRFDPGTSWISGNVKHIVDNINAFIFIIGPIEGDCISHGTITTINQVTGGGVGQAFLEIDGTWIADDEFNGLPFYCYGSTNIRLAYEGTAYIGMINLLGTLGDYSIHLKADTLIAYNPLYGFCISISGEIAIIS